MDATDQELFANFTARRCESSFRQLVDRHLAMVFSVALRVTGERGLAEEIAQSTFTLLARTPSLNPTETVIAGWLYHTARNLALTAVRSEQRRRHREQLAVTMNVSEPTPGLVADHLESAMDELNPEDRDALILRFFEDRNLREVGNELGLSEDAARMRINRALEKLRGIFGKLGITGTTAWLAAALPASTHAAVPAGLGGAITTAALGGTALAATAATLVTQTTATTSTMTSLFNLKTAAAVLAAAAVTGTSTYVVKEKEVQTLHAEQSALNVTRSRLDAERQQAMADIQERNEQIALLQKEVADLPRLRGEVDRLNRSLADMNALESEISTLRQQLQASRNTAVPVPAAPSKPKGNLEYDEVFLERYGLWNEEQVKAATIERLNKYRILGLGLIMYADANKGWFPKSIEEAQPYINDEFDFGKSTTLLFTGHVTDMKNPSQTIVARQSRYSPTAEGNKFWRVYTFGDGHSEVRSAMDQNELTSWENEHTLPLDSQSQRPE